MKFCQCELTLTLPPLIKPTSNIYVSIPTSCLRICLSTLCLSTLCPTLSTREPIVWCNSVQCHSTCLKKIIARQRNVRLLLWPRPRGGLRFCCCLASPPAKNQHQTKNHSHLCLRQHIIGPACSTGRRVLSSLALAVSTSLAYRGFNPLLRQFYHAFTEVELRLFHDNLS